jgi:proteic killer suppression protein
MYINFINNQIKKLCENHAFAIKKLGNRNADRLFQRVAEIRASENLADLMKVPSARCHHLSNDRKGQLALDLVHPKRLITLPTTVEGQIIETLIKELTVIEVVDYHR